MKVYISGMFSSKLTTFSHCSIEVAMRKLLWPVVMLLFLAGSAPTKECPVWMKYEHSFTSSKAYDNPLYDLKEFAVLFSSPSGRQIKINGFWDGGTKS